MRFLFIHTICKNCTTTYNATVSTYERGLPLQTVVAAEVEGAVAVEAGEGEGEVGEAMGSRPPPFRSSCPAWPWPQVTCPRKVCSWMSNWRRSRDASSSGRTSTSERRRTRHARRMRRHLRAFRRTALRFGISAFRLKKYVNALLFLLLMMALSYIVYHSEDSTVIYLSQDNAIAYTTKDTAVSYLQRSQPQFALVMTLS